MDDSTRRMARAREDALSGRRTTQVRPEVRASWNRARLQGVHPDRSLPPVELADDRVRGLQHAHPLAAVWPTLLGTLSAAATEPGHLVFVSDAAGHLLWVVGDRPTRKLAERANLVPGALWSESQAGTSGVGTALALRRPFQVRGREHFLSVAVEFTCSAAPIRNPVTGETVGAVDVTCPAPVANSLSLSLVAAAAQLAEAQLGEQTRRHDEQMRMRYVDRVMRRRGLQSALVSPDGRVLHASPHGWLPQRWPSPPREGPATLPDGRQVLFERLSSAGPFAVHYVDGGDGTGETLHLRALGRDRALVDLNGATHELSSRHSELVVLLAAHPAGLPADTLAREAYGPGGKTVTVRAEMTRLRRVLGHRLGSDPYRLLGPTSADFLALDEDLPATGVGELLDRYPGPLLPSSRSEGVAALRDRLHHRLRGKLLSDGDADALTRWVTSPHGRDDPPALQALRSRPPGGA
ncbi:GAF domain-containing protein [Nonomuraea sp. NPDC000554]|uniref:GAF domain-containing protein n=1 Tax=Nonomuraea sp. NPDC000554 TaxID=3154259 RepID=UPI0033250772